MIKRKNKITALLIAATSIMTLVPAMAADSTSKLDTKDGTIQHAVAFKDGKYIYEGYKSDDDDQGIYYNGGDKDKLLDDIQDADIQVHTTTSASVETYSTDGSYQDKYAFVQDGSDQYLVDLTNGDVSDDDTPEDYLDTAKTKLKSALKKTDRYGEIDDANIKDIYAVPGVKFDENTWYGYEVDPVADADNAKSTNYLYGFTTQKGKYIDASNLANIYAYSTAKGKYVKIEEYDKYDSDDDLTATLLGAPEVLAQDKDYIYAKVKVNIIDSNEHASTIGTTTGAPAEVGGDTDTTKNGVYKVSTHTYIQKIEKAQGDKKDDAYLPKSVTSYEISDKFDSGDADDAVDALDDSDITGYSVVNGQLLVIKDTGSNVKVTSLNLKKDKVKFDSENEVNDKDGHPFGTSDKVDAYLVEKDDNDDVDVDENSDAASWDIDVDGNVWVVGDGKIYKFKDNEMKQVYKCDSSLNGISVYDENNLITWEEDGDIYTTVHEGKTEPVTQPTTTPAKVGWDQLADGSWNFYDASGTKVINNWANVGGVWYYLDTNGTMVTGWQYVNGAWYYLNPNSDGSKGAMKTGWINVNGSWYYLSSSGAMKTGWVYDNGSWYYLNQSGAMQTGWINDGGTWYYLYSSGAMAANTTIDGYRLSSSGAWI